MARGCGSRESALEDPTGWDDGFVVAFCLIASVGRVPGETTDGSWRLHPLAVVADGERPDLYLAGKSSILVFY